MPSKKNQIHPLQGLTAKDFLSTGGNLSMTLKWEADGVQHDFTCKPRQFSTGSMGWGISNTRIDLPFQVPGRGECSGEVMLGCNFTIVNSKKLDPDAALPAKGKDTASSSGKSSSGKSSSPSSSKSSRIKSEEFIVSDDDESAVESTGGRDELEQAERGMSSKKRKFADAAGYVWT